MAVTQAALLSSPMYRAQEMRTRRASAVAGPPSAAPAGKGPTDGGANCANSDKESTAAAMAWILHECECAVTPPALEDILFVQMFTISSLVPMMLMPTDSPMKLFWLGCVGLALLGPLAFSAYVVLPAMTARREQLLGRLRRQASARGADLGDNFEFTAPAIQGAYQRHCMVGGGWLVDNLATCARLVFSWLLVILLSGKDVLANLPATVQELTAQWLAVSAARGLAVMVLGAGRSRAINAVLWPLYMALLGAHYRCWEQFGLSPVVSTSPCSAPLPSQALEGEMGPVTMLKDFMSPVVIYSAVTFIYAGCVPLLPADLHLVQSAPHLVTIPILTCSLVESGLVPEPIRLVCFWAGRSVSLTVFGVALSCLMWRGTEARLMEGFLKSAGFLEALRGQPR